MKNIYDSHRSPTKEEVLLLSANLELFLSCSMSFLVVPGRSVFLQTATFHRIFWLENLLKMNFMLDLITKLDKRRASVITK